MPHDHSPLCALRVSVFLRDVRLPGRWRMRVLKRRAAAEVREILGQAGASSEIWSHSFCFEGIAFLLSTHLQPARDVGHGVNGRRGATRRLAPRLVIEVAPAPTGLTPRTLLRGSGAANSKGCRQSTDVLELAA